MNVNNLKEYQDKANLSVEFLYDANGNMITDLDREYDSHARWYYPAIMRTTTLDPLAGNYYSISPYAWCGNNPVNRIDPDGMRPIPLANHYNNWYVKVDSWFGPRNTGLKGASASNSDTKWAAHLHYEIQQLIDGKWISINPTSSQANKMSNIIDSQLWITPDNKIYQGDVLPEATIIAPYIVKPVSIPLLQIEQQPKLPELKIP